MKLATLSIGGKPFAAVQLASGAWLDISKAAAGQTDAALASGSVQTLIDGGPDAMTALTALVARADGGKHPDAVVSGAALMAPIS